MACSGRAGASADTPPPAPVQLMQAELAEGALDVWPFGTGATVPLGHEWRKHQPGRTGIWTYRLQLPRWAGDDKDVSLYIPRAGNRLRFVLNGTEIAAFGDLKVGHEDFSPYPLLIHVPAVLLHSPGTSPATGDELLVQVAGDSRRYTGLSTVWWGRTSELASRYTLRRLFTDSFFYLILVLDVVFAVVSTLAGRVLRQKSLFQFGITSALGAVHYYFWRQTSPDLPFGTWLFVQDLSLAWNLLGMQLLCFHIMGVKALWLERFLKIILLWCYPVASALSVLELAGWPKFVATNLLNLGLTLAAFVVIRQAWKHRNYVNVPMAIFSVACLPAMLWTQWNAWVSPAPQAYEQLYLTPYVRLAYMVVMTLCLMVFLLRTVRAQQDSQQILEATLSRQRAELTHYYEAQQVRLRTEALNAERERIMRDMHDGLGANLVGLLGLVQSAQVSREMLLSEVQDTIDQLRLTIDAMESFDGDLASLLGQVRFRMQPRLIQAGIALHWTVADIPETVVIESSALAHVQRVLVEVFVNILKHSAAQEVTVQVLHHPETNHCSITVSDDGRGFDPDTVLKGHGLNNIAQRMQAVGASVLITPNEPKGTRIHFTIPCGEA